MAGFFLSAAGVGGVVLQMLAVAYPDGDPAKAREAAQLLRQLAERVDASLEDAEKIASMVWRPPSSGAGIDAFREFFAEDLAPYPPRVSAYIRGLADAVDGYADMLEQVQHTLQTMAMIQWLELLMFFCWPAIDKKVQVMINWGMRKSQARLLLRMFNHALGKRFIYATGGSLAYTALDQTLVNVVKFSRGEDIDSLGEISESMLKNFAACMVFYHVDPANFGKAANLLPKNKAAQTATVYMVGSTVFSVTANVLNRPGDVVDDPAGLFPTWEQMLAKLGIAAGQDQFRRWRGY